MRASRTARYLLRSVGRRGDLAAGLRMRGSTLAGDRADRAANSQRTSIATLSEVPHAPLYAPVTQFDAEVDSAADLPALLPRRARAMSGSPRPAHLDLNGLQAEIIETGPGARAHLSDPALSTTHAAASADAVG